MKMGEGKFFDSSGLLSYHTSDALADTMRLVSAYTLEQELQRTWREERENFLDFDDKHLFDVLNTLPRGTR